MGLSVKIGLAEDLRQCTTLVCRWILFGIENGCEERTRSIKEYLGKAKETFDNCKESE